MTDLFSVVVDAAAWDATCFSYLSAVPVVAVLTECSCVGLIWWGLLREECPPTGSFAVVLLYGCSLRMTWMRLLLTSQSHIAIDSQSISNFLCRAPSVAHDQIFIALWQLRSCFYGAPSLMRGRVCLLYMLLALAIVVFLGSELTIVYCLRFQTSLFIISYDF
jgi:hypothetical protein